MPIKKVHVIQSNHFDAGYHDIVGVELNEYFDTYIPRAINVSRELKTQGGEERIRWMCQSWILSMYLDCPAGAGLHCPDAAALGEFHEAVRDGAITWRKCTASSFVALRRLSPRDSCI